MQIRFLRSYAIVAICILWALAMAGCEQKTINEIKAMPNRYANHDVAVIGTVTKSYSLLGRGAYEVQDETGSLWVISDKGVPRKGARVAVKGKIRDAFNLSSFGIPEPISSGLVMIEDSHKAK